MNKRIILASGSPRRIELLKEWGLEFEVIPSTIEEMTFLKRPSFIVKDLAYRKGKEIADKNPNALVLSADTIVVLDGEIIGKPKDMGESEQILRRLNGSINKVYTGVSIIDNVLGKTSVFYDLAVVKMKKLPENELRELFGKHQDKAGSYAVQDTDDAFVKAICGDYYTVVGLPFVKLVKELKKFKIYI